MLGGNKTMPDRGQLPSIIKIVLDTILGVLKPGTLSLEIKVGLKVFRYDRFLIPLVSWLPVLAGMNELD
jgi:hypothetical protein